LKPEVSAGSESQRVVSLFSSLSYEEQVGVVSSLLSEVAAQEKKSPAALVDKYAIPFGIFAQKKLSSLEAIVKYLKEVQGLQLVQIASLLGRDSSTIWSTYGNASKKMLAPFSSVADDVVIPASLIADRTLSVLEHIVFFAKNLGYSNHEIAIMLQLDDRTIWSVLHRAKKKRGVQ